MSSDLDPTLAQRWATQEIIAENAFTQICNAHLKEQYVGETTLLTHLHLVPKRTSWTSGTTSTGGVLGSAQRGLAWQQIEHYEELLKACSAMGQVVTELDPRGDVGGDEENDHENGASNPGRPAVRAHAFLAKEVRMRRELLKRLRRVLERETPQAGGVRAELDGLLTLFSERVYSGQVVDVETRKWRAPDGGW